MPPLMTLIVLGAGVFALLVVFAILARYLRLWVQSVASGAGIGLFDLVAMSFKKVNPAVIVRSKIMAVQAGLGDSTGLTSQALESHYLAGGRVPLVVQALIAAHKAKITELTFKRAAAIDLAGRNVREAVQTSVYPKVIDCPGKNSGRESLDAVAKNGIQLKVKARVTVRTNLYQLIGGATEETIIARVGEGIVSAIGSAERHTDVLENPDVISKTVLARRLDANTAFEIVSIDIADIDVGANIGARRSGGGRHACGPRQRRGPPRDGRGEGAGDDREHRGEPGRARAGRGGGAQGRRRIAHVGPARHLRLLQVAEPAGRHRHAADDRRRYGDAIDLHGAVRRNRGSDVLHLRHAALCSRFRLA